MTKRKRDSEDRIKSALDNIVSCLEAAEVAFAELRSAEVRIVRLSDVHSPAFARRLENRIVTAALAMQRLGDATRRLLKRIGQDIEAFDRQLGSSLAISVTNRLADSWKHGLGGRGRNATLLNGVLSVRRQDGYKDQEGFERVHVVGMMVTDAADGAFQSGVLLEQCAKDWGTLLEPFVPEVAEWVPRVAPDSQGPVVSAAPDTKPVVPLGATIQFALPDEMRRLFAEEARRRSDSA